MNDISFNVLREQWIPVKTLDGEFKNLGIREVLFNAHELREIQCYSPLFSYGIHRILIAFLIDALLPKRERNIKDLIKIGSFDENAIENYIEKCNSNGERFNLFDEKRPFLQSVFKDTDDNDVEKKYKRNIIKLFEEIPSGNNHVHFNHRLENVQYFTSIQCAQALCAQSAYAINFSTSKSFGINNEPPIYFLYSGDNLFETLALSMVSLSKYEDKLLSIPLVAWREEEEIGENEEKSVVSLLHGIVSMPRRIQLIPEEGSNEIIVKKMWYSKGYNYKNVASWEDPHVLYFCDSKDEQKALRARENRAVWRDLGTILTESAKLPALNNTQYRLDIDEDDFFECSLKSYSLVGANKGTRYEINSWSTENIPLSLKILDDKRKTEILCDIMKLVEEINIELGKIVEQTIKNEKNKKGIYRQLSNQAQTIFLSSVREYIFSEVYATLNDLKEEEFEDESIKLKKEDIGKELKFRAINAFREICDSIGRGAKDLRWQVAKEGKFRIIVNLILVKGGFRDGNK